MARSKTLNTDSSQKAASLLYTQSRSSTLAGHSQVYNSLKIVYMKSGYNLKSQNMKHLTIIQGSLQHFNHFSILSFTELQFDIIGTRALEAL